MQQFRLATIALIAAVTSPLIETKIAATSASRSWKLS